MATKDLAQGLASLGRNGDSMLVHMNPQEVAGLQSLAGANGTSLTINPHTGMPEAFNLGRVLGSVAQAALPIAAGFALGPGGLTAKGIFSSSLGAGLAVGAGAYALTGDPMYALSAGLGGAGGFGLGQNLGAYGKYVTPVKETALVGAKAPTPGINLLDSGASGLKIPLNEVSFPGLDKSLSTLNATDILKTPRLDTSIGLLDDVLPAAATKTVPTEGMFKNQIAGVKGILGTRPEGSMDYADFLKKGYYDPSGEFVQPSMWQDVATVGMPILTGLSQQPEVTNFGTVPPAGFDYKGPYTPQEREIRVPTAQQQRELAQAGSPEYQYFSPMNPYPGFRTAYAQGGAIATGGIRDLYGTADDQLNGSTKLSQDGYGLGRLDTMYGTQMAEGGPVSFEAGGTIPTVGNIPEMSQAAQASYAVAPTNLAEVAAIGKEDTSAPGVSGLSALNKQMSQATSDPMGRLGRLGSGGMSFEDMMALRTNPFENMGRVLPPMARASLGPYFDLIQARRQREMPAAPAAPTMQDYIQAANRTPLQAAASPAGAEQQYFNQVNPQPVLAAEGGIMGLAKGGKPSSGGYLDGPGDGMSDSIPATIEGKQPARLADGEFVIPADVVSHLGNGSTKAGAKHLYKMMAKVRQARTGTKKQGRQINPSKYLRA